MWLLENEAELLNIILTLLSLSCLPAFRPRTIGGAWPVRSVQWINLRRQLLLHPPQSDPPLPCRTSASETWIRVNAPHFPATLWLKCMPKLISVTLYATASHRPSSSGSQPPKQQGVSLWALWEPSMFVKRHWRKRAAFRLFSLHLGNS